VSDIEYGVYAPFLSYTITTGPGFGTLGFTGTVQSSIFAIGAVQFAYYYIVTLRAGITYDHNMAVISSTASGILSRELRSSDNSTVYYTFTDWDTSGTNGVNIFDYQTFTINPPGYSPGDWVPCRFNVSSTTTTTASYNIVIIDPNGSFTFYEV
jgi:hypothetical protein